MLCIFWFLLNFKKFKVNYVDMSNFKISLKTYSLKRKGFKSNDKHLLKKQSLIYFLFLKNKTEAQFKLK